MMSLKNETHSLILHKVSLPSTSEQSSGVGTVADFQEKKCLTAELKREKSSLP